MEPPSSSLITRVRMRRHSCSENRSGGLEETRGGACSSTPSLFPPHPGPNRDPDIKGRWSETMKLQVRCQLPFETKHSPNPGKTELVPGIRTNKEELKGEWQRSGGGEKEEWRRRFYRPCWQYSISIKGPNSALNYPPVLLYSQRTTTACLGVWECRVWEIGGERAGCT